MSVMTDELVAQRCVYCTRVLTADIASWDHDIPKCRGGAGLKNNKVPACRRCNNHKGPLTRAEYELVKHDSKARKEKISEVLRVLGKIAASGLDG